MELLRVIVLVDSVSQTLVLLLHVDDRNVQGAVLGNLRLPLQGGPLHHPWEIVLGPENRLGHVQGTGLVLPVQGFDLLVDKLVGVEVPVVFQYVCVDLKTFQNFLLSLGQSMYQEDWKFFTLPAKF